MKKLTIALVLSLSALQPALADSTRLQGMMNRADETTRQFFMHPANLGAPCVAPVQRGERLTADDKDSLALRLRWHNEALAALGLKLSAESSRAFQGENLWMTQECTSSSRLAESESVHMGIVR